MDRCLKLYLQNSMFYIKSDENLDSFIARIYKEDPGFETISIYDFEFGDEGIKIANNENGFKLGPPSLEPQPDPCPGNSIALKEGSYLFTQMPVPENASDISRLLMPFLRNSMKGKVYVRLYKENMLECVMQFFLPL